MAVLDDEYDRNRSEWIEVTKTGKISYHEDQFKNTYRSTVHFCNWLESQGLLAKDRSYNVADIGAGQGANIFYLSRRFPNLSFEGIDVNADLVKWGNSYFQSQNIKNCRLIMGDLYDLPDELIGKYEGILSIQTLMGLPDYKLPMQKMLELKPEWIAITSLFYEGDVNCKVMIQDYTKPTVSKPYMDTYYNTYSLRFIKDFLENAGYHDFQSQHFEIDIDLPKPGVRGMATYTETLKDGRRIQISGPLLMNWYFLSARRIA